MISGGHRSLAALKVKKVGDVTGWREGGGPVWEKKHQREELGTFSGLFGIIEERPSAGVCVCVCAGEGRSEERI